MSSYIGSRRFAVELRNEAGAFPKLYRAPVCKLLSVLECRFIAGRFQNPCGQYNDRLPPRCRSETRSRAPPPALPRDR